MISIVVIWQLFIHLIAIGLIVTGMCMIAFGLCALLLIGFIRIVLLLADVLEVE